MSNFDKWESELQGNTNKTNFDKWEEEIATSEVAVQPPAVPVAQVTTPAPEPQPQDFATTRIAAFNEKRPEATPEEIAAYSDALKRAEGVDPELTSMQKIGLGPVGTATEFVGDIPGAIGRTAETAKQQISQIPEKAGRTISDIIFAAGKAKNLVDRASKNVPTAVSGLVNMFPAFATQLGRGATDVVASGAELVGKEDIANKIREEGKLAEDTAKQWAGLETNAIRRAAGEPEVDVVGQGIAEELAPEKKQGALAKAMRSKFLFDASNLSPEDFNKKYPEALPIDTFNAKFEQVLADNSLPTTIRSFLVDMPVESVKTIYGAISGNPEVWKKFEERPAETIVETGVGLGIGAKTIGELKGIAKDIAKDIAGARQRVALPDAKDFTDTFNKNQQQQMEFLRKRRIEKEMAQRAEQPIAEPKLAQTEVPIPPTEAKPIDRLFQKKETTEPTKDSVLKDYSEITGDTNAEIIAFGSREKGTAKPESDFDFIIKPSDKIKYSNAIEHTKAITPILSELKKKYPNADIQITKDDGYIDMLKESVKLSQDNQQATTDFVTGKTDVKPTIETPTAKEPWQMTKEEFDSEAWFRGQKDNTRNNTGFWTTKPGEAEIYAKNYSETGGKPQILMATNKDFAPETFEYYDVELPKRYKNAAEYRTENEHIPGARANNFVQIPVDRVKEAHKFIIEQALSEGKPVPPEVLAEYPDLKQKPINKLFQKNKEIPLIDEEGNKQEAAAPYSSILKNVDDINFEKIAEEKGLDPNLAKVRGPFAKLYQKISEKETDTDTYYRLKNFERVSHINNLAPEEMKNLANIINSKGEGFSTTIGNILIGKDAKEMFKDVMGSNVDFVNKKMFFNEKNVEKGRQITAWVDPKDRVIKVSIPAIENLSFRQLKNVLTHEATHLRQLKEGQNYDTSLKYEERPMEKEAYETGKKYQSGKLSMFGAGNLQNAYEAVEPSLKKGMDIFKKKGEEFLKDEEGSLDMQALYDAVTGGKVVKRTPKTTVGDPALQQELLNMYEKGRAIQEKQMTEAIARRQTTGSAIKQSLLDAYSPLFDKTGEKSTPAEREAIMKSVHDTFYINSNMEGFLREFGDYILKPVKDAGMTYDDYNGVLTARNILEGRKNVKSVWTPEKAQAYLDTIPKDKLDILNKATTEFHEKVWKPILQDLIDNKLADKETIDNIIDNESYAPTFLQKYLELDYGKREHGVNSGIYNLSAEGSTGEMLDPTAMKLQKGMAMIAAGKINKAKYDMAEAMFKAAPQDITEAKKVVKGFREVDDPNNPGQKVKDPKDPTKNLKLPVYEFLEPKGATGLSLITFRDGKDMRGVYVPKEIAQGFEAATGHAEQLGAAMKFWSAGNQAFRNMWIEYNPFWQVFTNLPKDAMTATVLFPDLKSKGTLVKNLFKTQSQALMGDFAKFFGGIDRETFEKNKTEMLKRGETMSSMDRQYATEPALDTADRLFKMYGIEEGKRGFLQKVSDFGKDIEAATKMAARMTIEERGLKSKFTPEEQVNIVRRTGSPAFPVRGFGELNSFVKNAFMFFNAMKEGWRAATYLAKKDPVSAAASAAVPLGLYAFTLAAENGAFGEDAKIAYSKMNKNHKKMNITIPLYYSKNGEINYLTIPMAPFLAPMTDAMRIAVKDNPSLISSIVSGITNNALPMVNPLLQNIIMLSSADKNNAPVNNFTGQKIMSDNQWRAGGMITTDAFMRQFWNNYMLGSQWRLSVDPFNPNQPQTTIPENLFKLAFGKLIRTANETPREGVDEVQRQKARGNLISEQIGYDPSKAKELMKDAKEQGLPISMKTIQNTMKAKKIAGMKTVDADKAALIKAYFSAATREEKMLVMKQIKDRMKKK